MAIWYTSDTHFNHLNVVDYCDRPFRMADGRADIPAMNEALIKNWNEVVGTEDTVYHIGDFCMGDKSQIPNIARRLNGKKILVLGNHDYKKPGLIRPEIIQAQRDGLFASVVTGLEVVDAGRKLMLKHEPEQCCPGYTYALCGHVHQAFSRGSLVVSAGETPHWEADPDGMTINVGVDVSGYRPMTLDQLLARPFIVGERHRI